MSNLGSERVQKKHFFLLTIPTEVIAVTVLMMVGMGLNLPACSLKNDEKKCIYTTTVAMEMC